MISETEALVVNPKGITLIAIPMIVLGVVAIVFPFFATITSTLLFGSVFIFAGIAQIVFAIQSRAAGRVVWKLVLGCLYLLAGIVVVANPLEGVLAFTLILGVTIFVQSIIQLSIAVQMRQTDANWLWMLVSGIVGIIFGLVVWSLSPFSAAWLIGILLGTNLLFDGIWMLTLHSGQPTNDPKLPEIKQA